jgi:hypothetical protein
LTGMTLALMRAIDNRPSCVRNLRHRTMTGRSGNGGHYRPSVRPRSWPRRKSARERFKRLLWSGPGWAVSGFQGVPCRSRAAWLSAKPRDRLLGSLAGGGRLAAAAGTILRRGRTWKAWAAMLGEEPAGRAVRLSGSPVRRAVRVPLWPDRPGRDRTQGRIGAARLGRRAARQD